MGANRPEGKRRGRRCNLNATATREIRGSRTGLLMTCPASGDSALDDLPCIGDGTAAQLGDAFHWCMAENAANRPWTTQEGARLFAVDYDELAMLVRWGLECWEAVRGEFPEPLAEKRFEDLDPATGTLLSGKMDLLSFVEDEARILDWKSGYVESDAELQLRSYGLLVLRNTPEIDRVFACKIDVRRRERDRWRWDREQLENWYADFLSRVGDGGYNPGSHCRYCPRGLTCPAKAAALRQAFACFLQADLSEFDNAPESDPYLLGKLFESEKLLKPIMERAHELVKAQVALAGGRLDIGDCRELRIVTQEQKRIDPANGWPILLETIGADRLMNAITVGKGKVEDAIGDVAAPRGKGKLIRATMEKLEGANAIVPKVVERLEMRKSAILLENQK